MKNQKILKELNNKLDPYNKLVEDIVEDLIKQNNEKKGIKGIKPESNIINGQYDIFKYNIYFIFIILILFI